MHLFASVLMDITAAQRDDRIVLLSDYLRRADGEDAGIALSILAGERPVAKPSPQRLRRLALATLSEHDLDRAKVAGADLLETLCLLLPAGPVGNGAPLSTLPLLSGDSTVIADDDLADLFHALPPSDRPALGEVLSGRAGRLMSVADLWCALARAFGANPEQVFRLWFADDAPYRDLITWLQDGRQGSGRPDQCLPRPFSTIADREAADPGPRDDDCYFAEETVGHRVQVVTGPSPMIIDANGRRLTGQFPELVQGLRNCGATLLEGMLVPAHGCSDPAKSLSRRLTARKCTAALVRQHPIVLQAHDFWQQEANDLSSRMYADRRLALENWLAIHQPDRVTPWPCHQGQPPARAGLLVRDANHEDAIWRTINARQTAHGVVLYVKTERGRAISTLTLGVRDGDDLIPIGDVEPVWGEDQHRELLKWARQNAQEKFGPVISVPAENVIEFSFRGILPAPRRKSGFQLNDMIFVRLCNRSAFDLVPDVSVLRRLHD